MFFRLPDGDLISGFENFTGVVESFPLPSGSLPACIPDISYCRR